MVPHVAARAAALAGLGWKGRDAEWLALVCLHSGAFLRSQYLAFRGDVHTQVATRFVRRCGDAVVEEPWMGRRERLCRVVYRGLYRALGVENIRHRRAGSSGVMHRRVLSLDYVLEHAAEPWLATEQEKVAGLVAAGVPREVMPKRVYAGANSARGQQRYFVHKLPVACGGKAARFVYVQPAWDVTQEGLRTWGKQCEGMWSALIGAGVSVSVSVVGLDPVRLEAAAKILRGWERPAPPDEEDLTSEVEGLRAALKTGGAAELERFGGFDAGLAKMVELQRRLDGSQEAAGRGPRITSGETWRSVRVGE